MTIRRIVTAYFSVSAATLVFGGPMMQALWSLSYFSIPVFCLLGPTTSLAYAIRGGTGSDWTTGWTIMWPVVWFYLFVTALLAFCLVLCMSKTRSIQIVGYSIAGIIWMTTAILTYGVSME